MYHSFNKDNSAENIYCVSPDTFENDLKYITQQGYTTVTPDDLINYVKGGDLPDKIVMLTMDDGFYNNYLYAYPLLKKYKCKALLSPVSALSVEYSQNGVVNEHYSYCTIDMLKEMENSGYVEMANHSYDMHNTTPRLGISQMQGESDEIYIETVTDDVLKAQEFFAQNGIAKPICFTYPYGIESKNTLPLIKKLGFKCTLTCSEITNTIYRDENCLYELGRYLRLEKESSENFFERICD